MKFVLAATVVVALSSAAAAQSRPPGQIAVDNRRAANLTSLEVLDGEGKVVGRLAGQLAAGKKT
ncbi:MAG: hypothetical protein ACRCTI_01510, partial [Beijerinckiaceae bacterium]